MNMRKMINSLMNNRMMMVMALSFIMCHLSFSPARAQKFALIDMDYVLKNIPA